MTMAYTGLVVTQEPDGSWTVPLNEIELRRARHFRVLWFTDGTIDPPVPPTAADGLRPRDVVNGEPVAAVLVPVAIGGGQVPVAVDDDVRITKIVGVYWTVGGVDYHASDIPGATLDIPSGGAPTVNVVAHAEPGYTITSTPTSWTISFGGGSAATFSDDFGDVALSEAAFLARATPVGGATVTKAGTGSVTVNASGHLVINASSAATAVEWELAGGQTGGPGEMAIVLESYTGSVGTIELVMSKTAATGTQARAVFDPAAGEYWAQVTVSNSSSTSAKTTGQIFTAGSELKASMSEDGGGIATVTAQHDTATPQTHTGPSAFTDNGRVRVFCSAGRTVTVRSVSWDEAV